ncbi:MAG: isoaspartyl peptidase/L-asparaginase [Phycisphaeraceae bacterium]
MPIALIVHGGAWNIPDHEVAEHETGCRQALEAGWRVLEHRGSALDAVEYAIRALEDAPIFNAGIGAVLNAEGEVELDAAIMDGRTLRSGAVAAVRRVRNPITLARRVLESHAALLVGRGADRFAERAGLPLCEPPELIVERERVRWDHLRRQDNYRTQEAFGALQGDRADEMRTPPLASAPVSALEHPGDTVGAVALDGKGHLAAATSTGGTANKLPGRVGDSPLIGCGLYADDQTSGCSSTGWGESIIKVVLAKTASDLVGAGHDPMESARAAIDMLARRAGGLGGCILLDARGRVGFAFNTPRMAYGYRVETEQEVVSAQPAR